MSFVSPAVFIIATWLAAFCGAVGVSAAFISAIVGYQLTEKSLKESDVKIAEANARQKEAELKLAQLRKLAGPRDINFDVFRKESEGKPKVPVAVWYLPDSSDGYWFATRLFGALIGAGWQVTAPPTPIPEADQSGLPVHMPRAVIAGGEPWGVTVVGDAAISDHFDPKADTPYNSLFNVLGKSTDFGIYGSTGSQFTPVPKGTLRVVVAAKADQVFIDDAPKETTPANPK